MLSQYADISACQRFHTKYELYYFDQFYSEDIIDYTKRNLQRLFSNFFRWFCDHTSKVSWMSNEISNMWHEEELNLDLTGCVTSVEVRTTACFLTASTATSRN